MGGGNMMIVAHYILPRGFMKKSLGQLIGKYPEAKVRGSGLNSCIEGQSLIDFDRLFKGN
jgi:hypothetical protein